MKVNCQMATMKKLMLSKAATIDTLTIEVVGIASKLKSSTEQLMLIKSLLKRGKMKTFTLVSLIA